MDQTPRLDLNRYRRGQGSADEFTNVVDEAAPWIQPSDEPYSDSAYIMQQATQNTIAIQMGEGPIHEVIQTAVAYSKLNPNDLSSMLDRIRLAKKLSELIPLIQEEAEAGRESILIELGISSPKPVRKPRTPKN